MQEVLSKVVSRSGYLGQLDDHHLLLKLLLAAPPNSSFVGPEVEAFGTDIIGRCWFCFGPWHLWCVVWKDDTHRSLEGNHAVALSCVKMHFDAVKLPAGILEVDIAPLAADMENTEAGPGNSSGPCDKNFTSIPQRRQAIAPALVGCFSFRTFMHQNLAYTLPV